MNPVSILPVGSVLISSRAPVGYCAVTAAPMATNQGFRSLVLEPDLDPFFIRYYVLYSREYLEANSSGTTFKELSGSVLGDLVFPLPPANVQRAIAARINELFTEVDDGEAALERARGDLATWRKALLKAAVTGELTADWRAANPPAETGAELLARILTERRTRWLADPRNRGKQYVAPAGPNPAQLPELPDRWVWTNLGQLSLIDSGGTPPGIEAASNTTGEVPWFKVSSMSIPGNERQLVVSKWWLSRTQALEAGLRIFPAGSLVFPKLGGALLTNKRRLMAFDGCLDLNNMAVSMMTGLKTYIWLLFQEIDLADLSDGSVVPQLKRQAVESILVGLPPANELGELVSLLKDSFQEADELGAYIDNVGSTALRQSILAAAFRGDLVA